MPAASTSTKHWGLQIEPIHIVEKKNIFEGLQVWLIPVYVENERSAVKDYFLLQFTIL